MIRSPIRWSLVLAACFFAGCGPASSIQPGIPKDPGVPFNPTPDMGPNPPATKK